MEKTKTIYLCTCQGQGVSIEKWDDDKEIYLSLWERGVVYPWGFFRRLSYCWHVLRTGRPWTDEIILSKDNAIALGKSLLSLSKKIVIDKSYCVVQPGYKNKTLESNDV